MYVCITKKYLTIFTINQETDSDCKITKFGRLRGMLFEKDGNSIQSRMVKIKT